MNAKLIFSKLSLFVLIAALSTLLSGCNKTDANIVLAKLVGLKVMDQSMVITSNSSDEAFFTAKHTGTLWTFVEGAQESAVKFAVLSEAEYKKLANVKANNSIWQSRAAAESFVEAVVEAGEKYYLIFDNNKPAQRRSAGVSVQSYFFSNK